MNQAGINYYKSVLESEWHDIDKHAVWLHDRCDSRLEVLFGLAVIGTYFTNTCAMLGNDHGQVDIGNDHLRFQEPWHSSPTHCGISAGFITCQHQDRHKWDFAIWIAGNNGATFHSKVSPPWLELLVDVDGYNVHRHQRTWDSRKSQLASARCIRLREEEYKDLWQMAEAVLSRSFWHMDIDDCEEDADTLAELVL